MGAMRIHATGISCRKAYHLTIGFSLFQPQTAYKLYQTMQAYVLTRLVTEHGLALVFSAEKGAN